jgi:hypothetical protein
MLQKIEIIPPPQTNDLNRVPPHRSKKQSLSILPFIVNVIVAVGEVKVEGKY